MPLLLESVEQRCSSMTQEVQTLQKQALDPDSASDHVPQAAVLFQNLRNFEVQYVNAMSEIERLRISDSSTNTSDAAKVRQAERVIESTLVKRSSTRVCFLRLVTAARHLAASMSHEDASDGALGCQAGLLESLELRAVRDTEAEETPGALTQLGAFWSELAVAGRSAAPLFGQGPLPAATTGTSSVLTRDSWGTMAPADIVHAEGVFAKSHGLPGFKRPALQATYANRLEQHAKFLDSIGQYDAAEQRYRAMAKLAEDSGHAASSAHALSQLSLSLRARGSQEEALVVAKQAVDLTMNPLAQFVLATVRLSSGLLTTDASVKAAAGQLKAVAGDLPTEDLEIQRRQMHSNMVKWDWISRGDMSKCTVLRDAASFMICTICKLMF